MGENPSVRSWDTAKAKQVAADLAYERTVQGHFARVSKSPEEEGLDFDSVQAEVEAWREKNNKRLVTCRMASTLDMNGNVVIAQKITKKACEKYRKGVRVDEADDLGTLKLRVCDKCPHCGRVRLNKVPRKFRKKGSGSGTINGINPNG